MANVSPGVFTKIIDLSAFTQAVPSTIGFLAGLSKKGRDNELVFVGSRSQFISEWGEPNITEYGKNFGQGPYIAYNFLGESGALYWIRALPDDATYSNFRIDSQLANSDSSATLNITYIESLNSKAEITTNLAEVGDIKPICFLRPIGRGDYYNRLGIRLTEHSNPTVSGVYVLDVYEKQSDGDDVIIESFDISFNPTAVDSAGDSIFIKNILEMYSNVLRADIELTNGNYTSGYELTSKVYDNEIGSVSIILSGNTTIRDNKQDFSDWQTAPETGNSSYVIIAKDGRGNEIWGWLGTADSTEDNEIINVFPERNLTGSIQGWNGATSVFDVNSIITYEIRKSYISIASIFTSSDPVPLKKGSEGSLRNITGGIDTDEAENILEQAYTGILTNPNTGTYEDLILDTESVYFSVVFDAGYPSDVKTAISTLCQTRRDCVAIIDNGDNSAVNNAIYTRENVNTFNTYFVAIYEPYNKVSDPFTGEDVWFSPVFHISYLLPRNDNVGELWFAVAGFNRASIDSIKELRYNPRLGQRDQMYLKQLNPIVKFSNGYTVWGQLTSQARASALQDLNVVRLVLYCKKAIEQFCKYFIFEQNDAITWGQVSGNIVEFLESIKNKRGLDDYSVEVGATTYEKKTKKFHVNIILRPTKVVEQIELNFFIQ